MTPSLPDALTLCAWPAFENATGNPYNRLLYEAVERQGVMVDEFTVRCALTTRADLWHVHWPDDFLSRSSLVAASAYVAAELGAMALARLRGTRIVWTVHDLGPHESHHPALERLFWRLFVPLVDGIISLSAHAEAAALHRFPQLQKVPRAIVPHGHYRPAYPDPVPCATARSALDLPHNAPVLAYVGRIRPYKNVDCLIHAFRHWPHPQARLLVTGNPSSERLRRSIETQAAGNGRIRLDLRFVPDDDMPLVLGAADVVVLPYNHILHSGSALLALSFNRPVLVPARGAMGELQRHVGAEWVRTYDGELTASELDAAVQWAHNTNRPAQAPLDDLDWDVLAAQTVDLYRQVLAHP